MTRQEAAGIIARIRGDEIRYYYSKHASQRLASRRYSPHDVRAILCSHEIEDAPAWSDKHQNFKVCLLGQCLEGRPTRVVWGLRENGSCVLVTIMERDRPTERRNK